MKQHYTTNAKGKIKEALIAEQLQKQAQSWPQPEVVHLKNDGNVSRQIYNAVGHETLETLQAKEQTANQTHSSTEEPK